MPLKAHIQTPDVPHPSNVGVRLRCRLPDVEGAQKRVRSFFRFSPKQLRNAGFEKADSSARKDAREKNKTSSECEETTAVTCAGSTCGVVDSWESCNSGGGPSFGGGVWDGGLAQDGYNLRRLYPNGVNGGPIDSPDPETDPCESADPPGYGEIGCNLSAAELADGYYLFDQADDTAKETLINTLQKYGDKYGIDSSEDVRHFIAQTAHESQGAITRVENLNYQDAENLAATFSEFSIDGKGGKYKTSDYIGKPKEIAKIAYAGRLGNGEKGSGDAYKYRGRGPMQITGKDNYRAFEDWYQNEGFGSADFTEKPGKLSSNARTGTLAALQYWDENVLGSDEVDEDNLTVADITEAINVGNTELETRKDHFEKAKEIDCKN
ncbi:glycoside hydrolase family 19 protein [Salinibacter altiplanensis]|uniref:glycoside hydrolase family 19 protein n=1 Tax=Salinibacter altiplanensis TaxID=1803181 RepID=UPI001E532091|nr:hypothetical protein [Salinibacter altiplanensis]